MSYKCNINVTFLLKIFAAKINIAIIPICINGPQRPVFAAEKSINFYLLMIVLFVLYTLRKARGT